MTFPTEDAQHDLLRAEAASRLVGVAESLQSQGMHGTDTTELVDDVHAAIRRLIS